MKFRIFGVLLVFCNSFLVQFSLGAYVDIGNLPATISLHEDTQPSVFVYSFNVNPTAASCLISAGNADGNFDLVDAGNGQHQIFTSASTSFDATNIPSYTLTIQCTSGTASKTPALTISMTANSPFVLNNFIAGVATKSISATTVKASHVVFTLSYSDTDDSPPLTYSNFVTDPAGGPFEILAGTDHVVANQDLLLIQTSTYALRFDASDGRNVQSLEIQLTINDVNTPPSITNLPHVLTLPESTTGRLLVYTINYVDSDGDSIQFEIVSQQDAAGVFEIIPSTGEVYIKEGFTLDYETSTSFEYIVTIKDKYHYTTALDGNLTIVVSDANESPVWPSALDPVSVDESSAGTVVGTPSVLCTDPDGASDVSGMTYRILFGSYFSYFTIDTITAQVTFARAWDFDDKTLPETFLLTLQCVDPKGVSANADFNITILDINDNDPVCSPSSTTLDLLYSQATNTEITNVNCADADSTVNAELEYTILGLGSSKGYGKTYFAIVTTGSLTISTAFAMDYNTTFYITILVNDKGTSPRSTTVTFTVSYTEEPTIVTYEEITKCFPCTTGAIAMVAGAALVVAMLCIFFCTLCVLRCCYDCEKSKMKKAIASEHKVQSRWCDCCRPKRGRKRKKKKTAAKQKTQKHGDENMRARERFKEQSKASQGPKDRNHGLAPPGTVVSISSMERAEINQYDVQDSQWKKFRK